MNRLLLLISLGFAGLLIHPKINASGDHGHDDHRNADEVAEGPHGGRLLEQGELALEITIFERGVPPQLRVYAYHNTADRNTGDLARVDPQKVDLRMELHRLGGDIDTFDFSPVDDYLLGDGVVAEPHSFDVQVRARYAGEDYHWEYQSHEGRTQISSRAAKDAGVATATAGPARIEQTETLYGTVRANEEKVLRLGAPYAGRITDLRVSVGDRVQKGDVLASIQSSESLETYTITAPAPGTILSRHGNPGELIGSDMLLVLADLSELWIDFAAFPKQLRSLREGQRVYVTSGNSEQTTLAEIDYIAPVGSSASQSVLVRAVLADPEGQWLPGLLVTGEAVTTDMEVPLAVKLSALQTFRDFTVVFARFGETYEVRMLELGRRGLDDVEVLGGLKPGTEYVTENSYLIKADILKSGASHDH